MIKETKDRDHAVTAYLELMEAYIREKGTIKMLELEIRKRKIKARRLSRALDEWKRTSITLLTDSEKKDVTHGLEDLKTRIAAAVDDEVNQRLAIHDGSWITECETAPLILFDVADYVKPNVLVLYTDDQPAIVVDIVKSVRGNYKNLVHPLIVGAIERYVHRLASPPSARRSVNAERKGFQEPSEKSATTISLTHRQAEERLKKISAALITGSKERGREANKTTKFFRHFAEPQLDDDYFSSLSEILRDPTIN